MKSQSVSRLSSEARYQASWRLCCSFFFWRISSPLTRTIALTTNEYAGLRRFTDVDNEVHFVENISPPMNVCVPSPHDSTLASGSKKTDGQMRCLRS
jgi:hypothetical protein